MSSLPTLIKIAQLQLDNPRRALGGQTYADACADWYLALVDATPENLAKDDFIAYGRVFCINSALQLERDLRLEIRRLTEALRSGVHLAQEVS